MRAARSRASRRSAPTRVIRAVPCAPMVSPAEKSRRAFQASSVPRPSRSSSTGGAPGMFRPLESRPPAGSFRVAFTSRRSPFGTNSSFRPNRPPASSRCTAASRSSPSEGAPSFASPLAESRAGWPAIASPRTRSASEKSLISTLTGRSGSRVPSGSGVGATVAGTGRRSTSSRPISRVSTSSRPDRSARRRQTMRARSSFSQTPSRSLIATSRIVASDESAPSTAPMATRDDGVDRARERSPPRTVFSASSAAWVTAAGGGKAEDGEEQSCDGDALPSLPLRGREGRKRENLCQTSHQNDCPRLM